MQVSSTMQMQHMHQMRMHGQGQGGGNGKGMGRIMQNLTPDQRQDISSQLQNLSQEDRKSLVDQIKSLDSSSLSQDQLYQSILDILNPETQTNTITPTSIDTYA
jgi:hypothetical protein